MLSDQGYAQSFGPGSTFPYLAKTLVKQGELLTNYYAVAPSPLSNAIAMIGGQGPTVQTSIDCPTYTTVTPGKKGKDGQIRGDGCVYPIAAQTLPDQLTASGLSAKSYVEGMDSGPAGTPKTCRHPQLNSPDANQTPQPGDPYVTWRNPFVYFQSLVPSCASSDVALPQLFKDLKSANNTPSFSYIVPSPCNDGSGMTCPPASQAPSSTSTSSTGPSSTATTPTSATPGSVTATNPGIPPAIDPSPTDTGTAPAEPNAASTAPTTTSVTTPATSSTPTTTAPTSSTPTQTPSTGPAFTAPTDEQAAGDAADNFLRSVIPKIEASPAYKDGGLIVITFDEAPQSGPDADPSACCDNPVYPNLPASSTTSTTSTTTSTTSGASTTTTSTTSAPGTTVPTSASTTTSATTTAATTTSPTTSSGSTTTTSTTTTAPAGGQTTPTGGGGQVGLLLISKYVTPASSDTTDYFNHYSLLASIEELFSLPRLGYASDPSLPFFGPSTYSNFSGS